MSVELIALTHFIQMLFGGWIKNLDIIRHVEATPALNVFKKDGTRAPIENLKIITVHPDSVSMLTATLHQKRSKTGAPQLYWKKGRLTAKFHDRTLRFWSYGLNQYRGMNGEVFITAQLMGGIFPTFVEDMILDHGYTSEGQAIAPALAHLDLPTLSVIAKSRWTMKAVQKSNITDFWIALCGQVPTRDIQKMFFTILQRVAQEKRDRLVISSNPFKNSPRSGADNSLALFLIQMRLSKLVEIPNLRDIPLNSDEDQHVTVPKMAVIEDAAWILKRVSPKRRIKFLQNTPNTWWDEHNMMRLDTIPMLTQLKEAGIELDLNKVNSPMEIHDIAAREMRRIEHPLRSIPRQLIPDWVDDEQTIRVAQAETNWEVIDWGVEQDHCIGSYAEQAANGATTLLGFQRDGKWIGHCSINNQGHLDNLLSRNNMRLDDVDIITIVSYLINHQLIDPKLRHATWGVDEDMFRKIRRNLGISMSDEGVGEVVGAPDPEFERLLEEEEAIERAVRERAQNNIENF